MRTVLYALTQFLSDNSTEVLEFWLKNVVEAEARWREVPAANVVERLEVWRADWESRDSVLPVSCGTVACFGGWVAVMPYFMSLGVYPNNDGEPTISKPYMETVTEVTHPGISSGFKQAAFKYSWHSGSGKTATLSNLDKVLFGDGTLFDPDTSCSGHKKAHGIVTKRLALHRKLLRAELRRRLVLHKAIGEIA